jgi:hypothetical protein
MLDKARDTHFALALSCLGKIIRGLHPQPHFGAAAKAFSKRSAISGVTNKFRRPLCLKLAIVTRM